MSLFREDRVQFVPVVFDLIDHPLFHRWSPEGFKLYIWLRRHIWRDPLRAPREVRPFYEQGFLATYATKELIAKDCMTISSRSLGEIFKELREIGACRTENTGRGYVFLLGEWRRWTSAETGQEIYAEGWYLDLQLEEDPQRHHSPTFPPGQEEPSDKQNLRISHADFAVATSRMHAADRHEKPRRTVNSASINKEHTLEAKREDKKDRPTTTTTMPIHFGKGRLELAKESTNKTGRGEERINHDAPDPPVPGTGSFGMRSYLREDGAAAEPASDFAEVIATYEAANGRPATALEKELLAKMSRELDKLGRRRGQGEMGGVWIMAAIVEAVESGSSYVAPRRIEQICQRWQREGYGAPMPDGRFAGGAGYPANGGLDAARNAGDVFHMVGDPSPGSDTRGGEGIKRDRLSEGRNTPGAVTLEDRELWQRALNLLEQQLTRANFETWLKDSTLTGREGERFVVGVRNAFVRDWINSRLRGHLRRVLGEVAGRPVEVVCEVQDVREALQEGK